MPLGGWNSWQWGELMDPNNPNNPSVVTLDGSKTTLQLVAIGQPRHANHQSWFLYAGTLTSASALTDIDVRRLLATSTYRSRPQPVQVKLSSPNEKLAQQRIMGKCGQSRHRKQRSAIRPIPDKRSPSTRCKSNKVWARKRQVEHVSSAARSAAGSSLQAAFPLIRKLVKTISHQARGFRAHSH